MRDLASIKRLFDAIGRVDAIIATAGHVHFGPLVEMMPEQFRLGLDDKLMGQVNLVLGARNYLNDGGSFTLTSGVIGDAPILQGASAASVNVAIEGFVRGAAIELPRGLRINVTSPTMLEEAREAFGPFFRGFEAASGAWVALAYSRSVEGAESGRVIRCIEMQWTRDAYVLTTDIERFQFDVVHRYLSEVAYWSPGISREKVERAARNSIAFGLFLCDAQIGYARMITDTATFAYLADVFVLPEQQGKGLGKWMMQCVMVHPDLQGLRRIMLVTSDAHGLYALNGFAPPVHPERIMEKVQPPSAP
ncbi:short chain dehydrogenase [Candidatus Burkholderia brachyanthoides]|nr:short chain dehydrogenase [Candidatus Burkholderia brachyanthoides]